MLNYHQLTARFRSDRALRDYCARRGWLLIGYRVVSGDVDYPRVRPNTYRIRVER